MHLYIHVPFCARRCSYCDFAIAVRRTVPAQAFVAAIEREWNVRQAEPAWQASPTIDTVYFGGGTPSRLPPSAFRLIERFRADRGLAPGAEITLEANPDDVTPANAAAWLAAGVNRVSLGAQSFSPDALAWMHRTHDADRIGAAVGTLRSEGFRDISLDLIYALPKGIRRDWPADLDMALTLEPTHLSLYGLTVEPRTPLGRWTARGEAVPAAADRAAEEYLGAHEVLGRAGFEHYEVSNAARPGFRARHNTAYWTRAAFLGLGPSAHSGFGSRRAWNVREWEEYRRRIEAGLEVEEGREVLTSEQVELEELYLGLRTDAGVSRDRIPGATLERWRSAGWALVQGAEAAPKTPGLPGSDRVRLTAEGWLRLDALVASVTRY